MSTEERQLKFRAWDDVDKKFVFDGFSIVGETTLFGLLHQYPYELNRIINWKIQQYTGLKDKNGKEIYEGDILGFWDIDESDYKKFIDDDFPEFNSWDGKKIYKKSQISWNNNSYGWRMPIQSRLKISMKDVEVVGNIFESTERIP